MKNQELNTLDKIKEVLGLSVEKETKEIEVKDEVVLNEDVKQEEPKQEEVKVEVKYATQEELAQVESKFMNMFKAFLEEAKKEVKEVPQELSSQKEEVKEEVELSEVKEIVHSPENVVEKKEVKFSKPLSAMTPQERIYQMLNNK